MTQIYLLMGAWILLLFILTKLETKKWQYLNPRERIFSFILFCTMWIGSIATIIYVFIVP